MLVGGAEVVEDSEVLVSVVVVSLDVVVGVVVVVVVVVGTREVVEECVAVGTGPTGPCCSESSEV